MTFDSRPETQAHIDKVRGYIQQVRRELWRRLVDHDFSKLEEPELSYFDEWTPRLREMEYNSPEYKASLEALRPALEHHYANNRHHPEYHEDGILGMNLLDLLEMLADWYAATQRTKNGDLKRSIELNSLRFAIEPDLERILTNTARDLGWLDKDEQKEENSGLSRHGD